MVRQRRARNDASACDASVPAAGCAPRRRPRALTSATNPSSKPHSQSAALDEVHGYTADQRLTLVANFGSFVAVAAFAAGERRARAFTSLGPP